MNNLVNYKDKSPFGFCFLIVLYAIGAASIPAIPEKLFEINSVNLTLLLFFALKSATIIFPIYIIWSIGYTGQFKFAWGKFFKAILLLFPLLLVCVNNFPIVAIITGSAKLQGQAITYFYYALACLSIAVYEEVIFRGIIYKVIAEKKKDIWAVILSSTIFSLAHLINAFSLNIAQILMQLGYSFLIGACCCVSFRFSGSIYLPIILHFVYDIGGLLTDYNLVLGNIWDMPSIVFTAILGVLTFIYTLVVYFKKEKNESGNTKG